MKVARRPCFSAIAFTMYLKKAWRSAVTQHVVVVPVHLELAVGVLVVVLVGPQPSSSIESQISVMTS